MSRYVDSLRKEGVVASKRRLRRNACDGKERYKTQTEAVTAMIAFKRAHPDDHVRTYRYRGGWYFGHYYPRPVRKPTSATDAYPYHFLH